jgi:hypothetical protein
MHLRGRQTGSARVLHRFDHVVDQPLHCRISWVGDRLGRAAQHGVPHAGNLQNGHVTKSLMPPGWQ